MEKYFIHTFNEAINAVMIDGKYARGEGFRDGMFLKRNKDGILVLCDACRLYSEENPVISAGLVRQRFMITEIGTVREMSKTPDYDFNMG